MTTALADAPIDSRPHNRRRAHGDPAPVEVANCEAGPQSPFSTLQTWLATDIARTQARIEHAAQIERCERDRYACRAGRFWDDDRRLLAEELGDRLARNPARVRKQLRATPQGCDWLIERWGLLLEINEVGHAWTEDQTAIALDLLGTPAKLRDEATTAPRLADPAELARAEIRALRDQKARVIAEDEEDRLRAMADLAEPTTPEFRNIRRHEAGLHRRIKWALSLLELVVPSPATSSPGGSDRRERSMSPVPSPAPPNFTPLRPVGLTPGSAAPVEVTPPKPAPTRRPDPAKLRAKARHAARARRQDRPDR